MSDVLMYPRYFLSKGWTRFKLGVAGTLTLFSGGAIVYGIATSGVFSIIYGSVGAAGGIIIFGTTRKDAADARLAIDKYDAIVRLNRQQLDDTKRQLDTFDRENAAFKRENAALRTNVDNLHADLAESAKQIEKMGALEQRYEATAKRLEADVQRDEQQIGALQETIGELTDVKDEYVASNADLQQSLDAARRRLEQIEALYAASATSNEAHERQIEKLRTIVHSMQQLLLTVADEGDRCQEFADSIDKSLIHLDQQTERVDNTARVMDVLLTRLKGGTFHTLDANDDGVVTRDEFCDGVEALAASERD